MKLDIICRPSDQENLDIVIKEILGRWGLSAEQYQILSIRHILYAGIKAIRITLEVERGIQNEVEKR